MPNVVTDPEIIRRVKEAAGKGGAVPAAPSASPPAGRVVTDPDVIQAVKNRKRFNDAAAKKRQQILEIGRNMPDAETGERGAPLAGTSGSPTMANSAVTRAFEVAEPVANRVLDVPEHFKYGFLENTMSRLPFGDEYAAAGGTIGRYLAGKTGQAPEMSLREANEFATGMEHAAQEEYRQKYPWRDIGGQALGIGMTAPAGGAAAFGMRGAPAANVAKTFLPTKGSIGRLGQATVAGEVMGGLSGAGEGEGWERAENALVGTLGGGMTGMAVAPAIEGAVGLGSRLLSPITQSIANRARPESQATKIIAERFSRDNVPLSLAEQRLRAGGPDMVLADAGGANVRGLARTAVNTPGAAKERVTEFVRQRSLQQPQRITDAVTTVLRNPADFGRTTARMAAERERIASPLYKAAFGKRPLVNVSSVVSHIDKTVKPGSAIADLRPDGITATLSKLRDYFQTGKASRIDLEQLHNVKQEIDDVISGALRSGDNNKARAVLGVQRELLKAMDTSSPDYAKARGIWSSSHETERALEIGRNAFKMTADDMTDALTGMTPGEKEMVQIGLARAVQDQMEARGSSGLGSQRDVLKTVFGTTKIMKTLRAAFQDDAAFRRFRATLLKEHRMGRTADAVQANSTTVAQAADLADATRGMGPDVLFQALQGHPVQAIATGLRQAILAEKGINEKVADQIGDMLLSNDPTRMQRALQLLNMRAGSVQRIASRLAATQKLFSGEASGVGPDIARKLLPNQASLGQ